MDANTLWVSDTKENEILKAINAWIAELSKASRQKTEDVVVIVGVNWVSPCGTKGGDLDAQAAVVAGLLHANAKSIGILLMPGFSYTRGRIITLEMEAFQRFRTKGISMDKKFTLLFDEESRHDMRDQRWCAQSLSLNLKT